MVKIFSPVYVAEGIDKADRDVRTYACYRILSGVLWGFIKGFIKGLPYRGGMGPPTHVS